MRITLDLTPLRGSLLLHPREHHTAAHPVTHASKLILRLVRERPPRSQASAPFPFPLLHRPDPRRIPGARAQYQHRVIRHRVPQHADALVQVHQRGVRGDALLHLAVCRIVLVPGRDGFRVFDRFVIFSRERLPRVLRPPLVALLQVLVIPPEVREEQPVSGCRLFVPVPVLLLLASSRNPSSGSRRSPNRRARSPSPRPTPSSRTAPRRCSRTRAACSGARTRCISSRSTRVSRTGSFHPGRVPRTRARRRTLATPAPASPSSVGDGIVRPFLDLPREVPLREVRQLGAVRRATRVREQRDGVDAPSVYHSQPVANKTRKGQSNRPYDTKIKVETHRFKSFSREWPIKIVSHATSSSSSRWTSSNVVVTPRICASVIPECAVL